MGVASRNRWPIEELRKVFACGAAGSLPDAQLLELFVDRGEEGAFEAIVRRHGPMVWGVCRRILRDHHDAEDAYQATFLVLARKAGSVVPPEKLGNWLHGVAYQSALKARAMANRRRAREKQVPEMPEPEAGRADHRDDLVLLDQELSRLPRKYRIPIVLCDLEGRTHRDAASRLGWPIGTVSGRLSRARAMLAKRLARRGVSLSVATLAATASRRTEALARSPLSPGWFDATVRNSMDFATRTATAAPTIASARSVAIAGRVLQIMLITKLSYIGAAGLGIVLAVGGVRTLAFQDQGEARPGIRAPDAAPKSDGRDAPKADAEDPSAEAVRIERELEWMRKQYNRLNHEVDNLKAGIETRKARLESLRVEGPGRGADSRKSSEFPYSVPFEQGATRFMKGDRITILEVRGTADTFRPGHLYWIGGTYDLASHDRATLAAYITAMDAEHASGPTLQVQSRIVDRGSGTFTLYLPVSHRGWPHVSFYPADGGSDFGGNYIGTGDSVLKRWWGSKESK